MNNLNAWGLDSATDDFRVQEAQRLVDTVLVRARQPLIEGVIFFLKKPLSPLTLMAFEIALLGIVRERGRQLLKGVLNACEAGGPNQLPKDLSFECGGYRRRNQKTANRSVASRLGDILSCPAADTAVGKPVMARFFRWKCCWVSTIRPHQR